MAVTTDVDIANLALAKLGQDAITTLTSGTRDATIVNRWFNQNREYCLTLYDWTCVSARTALERAGKVAVSSVTIATPPLVRISGHTFVSGDLVTFESINGTTQLNGGSYRVLAYTSLTVTLGDTEGVSVAGAAYTAYTSGGFGYHHPTDNWEWVYALPSGCLRVLDVLDEYWGTRDGYVWKRDNDKLYCSVEYAGVRYLNLNTDPTVYDEQLVEVMVSRLAWLCAAKITGDDTVRRELYQEWVATAGQARRDNAVGAQEWPAPEALWATRG